MAATASGNDGPDDDAPALAGSDVPPAPTRRIGSSHHWALAGVILLMASFFFSWWTVTHGSDEVTHTIQHIRPFNDRGDLVNSAASLATGILAVLAIVTAGFASIAQTWRYRPDHWRIAMIAAALFAIGALVSLYWWPGEVPGLFTDRDFAPGPGATGPVNHERAWLGLGFYVAAVGTLCLVVASLRAGVRAR